MRWKNHRTPRSDLDSFRMTTPLPSPLPRLAACVGLIAFCTVAWPQASYFPSPAANPAAPRAAVPAIPSVSESAASAPRSISNGQTITIPRQASASPLNLAPVPVQKGNQVIRTFPTPRIGPGEDDVRQVAREMRSHGGSYEADINGAFAKVLRAQLEDPQLRVRLKAQVKNELPDGCFWTDFTVTTPDRKFGTVIRNKTLVYGPLQLTFTGRYCDDASRYQFGEDG